MGKVRVTNGQETFEIDGGDLDAAVKDGFKPTERIIVANSKTKESYEIDPQDVQHALKDGFTYQDIAKKQSQPIQHQPTQPAFQLNISQPTFKSAPLNTPVREFTDQKPYDELAVTKLGNKVKDLHTKIHTELLGNDALYDKKIRELRRDNYSLDNLRQDYKKNGWILPPQDEQKLLQKEKQKRYDMPVTPEDISDAKTGTIIDERGARKFVKDLNKNETNADLRLLDKYNEVVNDPNGNSRIQKIMDVDKKIRKGEVGYDPETKTTFQPLGLVGSIMEGVKNKFKADEEHSFLKNTVNDAAIIKELEDERNNPNTDEPIKVPKGRVNEFLKSAAEMPLTPIIAGAAGTIGGSFIGNPELGTVAASALGAYENRKAQFTQTFKQVYNELRNQGKPTFDALTEARKQAENAQEIGTFVGAAQGLIGAKIGAIPVKGTNFSLGFQKAIGDFLKKNSNEFGKIALDAAAQGGLAASGELAKNKLAQVAGIKRDIDAGTADAFWGNAFMAAGIGAALKLGKGLSSIKYKTILNGITKNVPTEAITNTLQEKVNAGEITQNAADAALKEINDYKEKDSQIPPNVTEEARFKIQDNIDKINELEKQKEATHKSLQGPIQEKIDKLTEENLSLSKETEKPTKPISGLSKDQEKEATELAEEWLHEGIIPEAYENAIKKDPIGFWKFLSQQAHNTDENWRPNQGPSPEAGMREDLGDTVVDYAKELFPAPEIKELQKSVSVIQPGEIKHPEAVTIGAGKVPPENIGHVEVSEHGEDTKTEAGQENGIEPSKLSEAGRKEAEELGQHLIDSGKKKVVTSEVERAQETAKIAAEKANIPIETNPVLNTWNIGTYDGKPEGSFVEEAWANKPNEAPEGGESFNDFTKRMEQAYQFVKSLPEDNHVISHSKVMRALEALKKTDGKWTEETTKDFLTNKELSDALQISGSGRILQHPQEGAGIEGSERGRMESGQQGEVPAGTRPEEINQGKGEEKVNDLSVIDAYGLPFIEEPGDKRTGIKNIISKATRFERRLPAVEVDKLGSDQEILLQGKSLVDNNVINPIEVVNRILDTKEGMQPDEAKAMQYYMHQLGQQETNLRERLAGTSDEIEQADINGQLQQLSDEIDAATQANIISGKAWSDVGNIRQIVSDTGFNASRDLATIKDAYEGKIPKDVQAKLDKAFKERDEALNKLAKLQAEEKNKAVDDTIKKQSVPKNTKKTKEQFKNERNDIKQSISEKLKQARSGQSGLTAVPLPFAKELIEITPEIFKLIKSYAEEGIQKTEEIINRLHEVLKDEIEGITKADIVNLLAGRYKAEGENVSKVSQRIRDYRTEANLWTKIAEATKMEEDTPTKKQEKNKKLQDLRNRLNDIRKRNNEAIAEAKDILQTDVQKELKKLTRQRRALETRYKTKKYLVPVEKTNSPISAEIIKEKQRIVNANYKIRIEKRKAFESKKNMYQKTLMWIGRGVRLSVLSGYNVLGKLAAAATIGGAAKRIPEQAIGFIYGNAFKGISEKAPIEGFVNASAEAKFYKEFFNPKTFAKNTWEILKSGESPLSKKFSPGTYEHIPGLYLPTDLHQVIKDPLKRGTYEASLKNALAWAERNGMDINDDLVIQSLETAAYKRAQYEIFQEQNWLSKKFGEWKHNMEESGNWGATGKFLADFMIPVSTVPTNIARRMVSTSPFGLIRGSAKVIEAYRNGIESLTPEQADSVMRQLKQGTLGTALWLIGWYGYSQFGGLYSKFNPNKQRDQGDLVSDEMSVGGKMVPKPVQHALPLEIIQFAATARRVYDNYRDNKNASTPESIEKAGLASIGALTEQIPVVETIAHTIGAFNNPYEAKKLEEDVRRRFEPQILRETGIISKDKGGSGGGAGATATVPMKPSKPTKPHRTNPHKR